LLFDDQNAWCVARADQIADPMMNPMMDPMMSYRLRLEDTLGLEEFLVRPLIIALALHAVKVVDRARRKHLGKERR
jgi:hypothetical protein